MSIVGAVGGRGIVSCGKITGYGREIVWKKKSLDTYCYLDMIRLMHASSFLLYQSVMPTLPSAKQSIRQDLIPLQTPAKDLKIFRMLMCILNSFAKAHPWLILCSHQKTSKESVNR